MSSVHSAVFFQVNAFFYLQLPVSYFSVVSRISSLLVVPLLLLPLTTRSVCLLLFRSHFPKTNINENLMFCGVNMDTVGNIAGWIGAAGVA